MILFYVTKYHCIQTPKKAQNASVVIFRKAQIEEDGIIQWKIPGS